MRPSFFLGFASLVLFLTGTAGGDHCTTWSTSNPEVDAAGWYVDNDPCQFDGCAFSIWLYQESNGIPGLQRADEVKDDTCHGMIEGDVFPCAMLPVALMTGDRRRRHGGDLVGVAALGLLTAVAFVPTAEAC